MPDFSSPSAKKILRYPLDNDGKTRIWARFREIVFEEIGNELKIAPNKGRVAYIYLPPGLSVDDVASYDSTGLGILGSLTERGIQSANVDLLKGLETAGIHMFDTLGDASKTLIDSLKSGGVDLTGEARAIIGAAANKIPLLSKTQGPRGIQSGARIQQNPHTRRTFEGVDLRSFDFSFNFLPHSESEAREINQIIQMFREIVYPEYAVLSPTQRGDAANGTLGHNLEDTFYYKYPSMIQVDLFYQLSSETMKGKDYEKMYKIATPEIYDQASSSDPLTQFAPDPILSPSTGVVRIGPRFQYCYVEGTNVTYDSGSAQAMHVSRDRTAAFYPMTTLTFKLSEDRTLYKGMVQNGY